MLAEALLRDTLHPAKPRLKGEDPSTGSGQATGIQIVAASGDADSYGMTNKNDKQKGGYRDLSTAAAKNAAFGRDDRVWWG
jgi:hypothetical protein